MKGKSFKSVVCILMALLLVAGTLTGCNGSSGGNASGGKEASNGSASSGETVSLTFWSDLNAKTANTCTSYEDVAAMKKLEEILNIDITWQHPPVGEEKEQFNLTVASMKLPDMMYYDWLNGYAGGPEKAVADKVILKLNDSLDKAPNLKALFDEYPDFYKQSVTDAGTLYMFPFAREICLAEENKILNCFQGPAYRKDLADALNIAEPRTIDELYAMFKAFKAEYGDDFIPYCARALDAPNGIFAICAAYGFLSDFYLEGDTVSYGVLSPNFKAYLETMVKWYSEGLIDPDFMANDGDSFKAKITNGDAGFYIGSQGGNWVTFCKVLETTVPEANLAYMHWPAGPDGKAYSSQTAVDHIVGGSGAAITTQNTNLDACLRYLDYGYSKEGIYLLNYGIEGDTYEVVDGKVNFTAKINDAAAEKGMDFVMGQYAFGGISSWATLQAVDLVSITRTYPGQAETVYTWGDCSHDLILPPISPTVDEATKLANIMNQIKTYRDETVAKIVMGQLPISECDTMVAKIKEMGIDEALEIENAALDRYNKR